MNQLITQEWNNMKKILIHTTKKSDAEKLADQLTNPPFDIISKIAGETIGSGIEPTPFEKIGDKINSILSKVTNGKLKTNGADGLTDKLKTYKK